MSSGASPRDPVLFQVNRALSIKHDVATGDLHVGSTSSIARIVRDPPAFLRELIGEFLAPATPEEAVGRIVERFGSEEFGRIIAAAGDLLRIGIIKPVVDGDPRYDRHHLYFQLYGVDAQIHDETLRALRVGIIGMGGLGSTVSLMLAAAGVGSLVISDGDRLEVSNLTRSILYREADIGKKKVAAAAEQIAKLNGAVRVRKIDSPFTGSEMVERDFADCDIIALTADRPGVVHDWLDVAARRLGIPYITAGYIETHAAVGPFVIPGETACYECFRRGRASLDSEEVNDGLQAASYGPLNALSAAVAANEILRYALGLPLRTRNHWALINLATLKTELMPVPPHPACSCGAARHEPEAGAPDPFRILARLYEDEREQTSLNRELIDAPIIDRIVPGTRVLDLGAGIGTVSRAAAEKNCEVVAVERSPDMLDIFRSRMHAELKDRIAIIEADIADMNWPPGQYDTILLILVLDHLPDPLPILKRCRHSLATGGRVQIVLPHPFKDSGGWRSADGGEGDWVLRDYFREGRQEKSRFDSRGNELPCKPVTWKRTLQGWMACLTDAGLAVSRMNEPRPDTSRAGASAQFARARKVPYFLMLECIAAPNEPPSG